MAIENTPKEEIHRAYEAKRSFFDSGKTLDVGFRKQQLRKLKSEIKNREEQILSALSNDMGKPEFESFAGEVGLVYREIDFMLKNIDKFVQEIRRKTPLFLKPSSSSIVYEPKGVVLIISPWNYPFHLTITPLIGALAAGNSIILKPSEIAPYTAIVLESLIDSCFDSDYISVLQGEGEKVVPELMQNYRLDHVLFTGSTAVGKKIAKMAAEELTPVTLELGGKSPAIIDKDVNLQKASKKIVWSKFFNAGQTCIAPDYALVHESVMSDFMKLSANYIQRFYGVDAGQSGNYARMINGDHLSSVAELLEGQDIYIGGRIDLENRYMDPTIVVHPEWDTPLMQNEIFGPILPVLPWNDRKKLLIDLKRNRYPLSCYVYTSDRSFESFILQNFEFGSACVNDSIVHLGNEQLPFGGIGYSGYGRYRGMASLQLFSNEKSILRSSSWIDPPIRYPNYTSFKLELIKKIFNGW